MSCDTSKSGDAIEQLLRERQDLWRASAQAGWRRVVSTGFDLLDDSLHDGGWPLGATTELLAQVMPWPLFLPALQARKRAWVMLINPPWLPGGHWLANAGVAPGRLLVLRNLALAEALWAADQSLRAGCCWLVCQWLPLRGIANKDLRQLQLAAASGGGLHVLIRPPAAAAQASPAALRLQLAVSAQGLELKVLKQRGGWAGQALTLPLWPELRELVAVSVQNWPVHLTDLPHLRHRQPPLRQAQVRRLPHALSS